LALLDELPHNSKLVAELVERAKGGNKAAFEVLYEYYRPAVSRYLLGLLGNGEDRNDLLQETFVKAWLRLSSLGNVSSFRLWLYKIATNLVYDYE
jgi:RNA polymerase sigma factor (sigma-70 family)